MLALLAVGIAGMLAGAPPPDRPEPLELRLGAEDAALSWPVADHLADGDVLRIRVSDGEAGASGTVVQCATGCWNRFPVTFDDDGVARFQYQLDRRDCDAGASCVVRITVGDRVAVAFTVFGGSAPPPPAATLEPAGDVLPGQRLSLTVSGLVEGTSVSASFCAEECVGRHIAAADSSGRVTLAIPVGARCDDCGIAVVAGASRTVLPVTFVPMPAPRYEPERLLAGLSIAGALLLAAWRLVTVTDWRPPSEAAVPDPVE